MKVKKSDINLLIMLVGVLVAVISYFVVYKSFSDKTVVLSSENAALQTEVDELQKLADNKEFYISETARMNEEIQNTMARYPSEVRTEDQVMYTVNLENSNAIWVNNLAVEPTQLVQVSDPAAAPATDAVVEEEGAVVDDAATQQDAVVASGGLKDTVFLYSSPFSISYKTTYRSAKDIVAGIVNSDKRMNISNITLAYDAETGCLSGTMDAAMFTMSGTGQEYEELNIPGVSLGTADFFKSGAVLNFNTNADGASEDGAEAEDEEASEDSEDSEDSEEGANEDDKDKKSDDRVTSE